MITGLNLDATEEFVSEFDPAKDVEGGEVTKFTLATLDSRVMGHLRDRATRLSISPTAKADDNVETEVSMNEVAFETVQFGLTGMAPFQDDQGIDIPFATQKRHLRGKSYVIASEVVINRLPMKIISEIADRLRKMNNLGDDEGN